jgi:uncharacterized membrane protein YfcA
VTIGLALISALVGLLIGSVGVGGVLLIPALTFLAAVPIHEAMATALFTFIFTGVVATVLFQRRGSIDWRVTVPVCVGGALCAFPGAWANSKLNGTQLTALLAVLIAAAGVYTLWSRSAQRPEAFHDRPRHQTVLLLAIGGATGFGSGLTGVGGPALSVPMLVLFGFSPLTTIGASQVVQILAALSGTAGNMVHGSIDFRLAALVLVFEIVGVFAGVKLAHSVDARALRRLVGALCVMVGAGLLARAL